MKKSLVVGAVAALFVGSMFVGCSHRTTQSTQTAAGQSGGGNGGGNGGGGGGNGGGGGGGGGQNNPQPTLTPEELWSQWGEAHTALQAAMAIAYAKTGATIVAYRALGVMPDDPKGTKGPRATAKKDSEKLRDEMNRTVGIMQNQFRKLGKVNFSSLPPDRLQTVNQQMASLKTKESALEQSAKLLSQKNPEKSGAAQQAQSILSAAAFK